MNRGTTSIMQQNCLQSVATIPQGHTSMIRMQFHTLRLILSICRFWFSNSEPMSIAMLRRLPIIVLTCPMFSSISSSRASFVILDLNIFDKHSNQLSNFPGHCPLSEIFYGSFSQQAILLLFQYQSTDWDIHLTVCFSKFTFHILGLNLCDSLWNFTLLLWHS